MTYKLTILLAFSLSPLTISLIPLAIILGILFLVYMPKLQIRGMSPADSKGRVEMENELRRTLVQIFGGIAIVATVFTAFNSAKQTNTSIELTRRGQIADRTFKAMSMLSEKDNVDAQVAAIYGLEQVADEYPQSEWQITQTLYHYVRRRCNWSADSFGKSFGGKSDDIRAIGNYLARRPYIASDGACLEEHQCWDYSKNGRPSRQARLALDKRIIDLPQVDLRAIYLEGAMLKSANINQSHMEEAWLRSAHLDNVYGEEVQLRGADLSDSYWLFANLKNANLKATQLCRAHLEHVYAEGADLENADLMDTYWSDSSPFDKANLQNANLSCSTWNGADMQDLFLKGAKLFGADLSRALHLTQKQLEDTVGDSNTKLPDESLRPSSWSSKPQLECVKTPVPLCPSK